jgi:hypothetical protein
VETRRWTNPSLPQTLQIGVILLYVDAFFLLLNGVAFSPIGLALLVGSVAGGYGIANERRWGYRLGVAVAGLGVLSLLALLVADGLDALFDIVFLVNLVFPVALFVALVHPQSREYQRIWFS